MVWTTFKLDFQLPCRRWDHQSTQARTMSVDQWISDCRLAQWSTSNALQPLSNIATLLFKVWTRQPKSSASPKPAWTAQVSMKMRSYAYLVSNAITRTGPDQTRPNKSVDLSETPADPTDFCRDGRVRVVEFVLYTATVLHVTQCEVRFVSKNQSHSFIASLLQWIFVNLCNNW